MAGNAEEERGYRSPRTTDNKNHMHEEVDRAASPRDEREFAGDNGPWDEEEDQEAREIESSPHVKRRRSRDYEDAEPLERSRRSHARPEDMEGEEVTTTSLLVRHLKFTTPPGVVRKFFERCGEVKDVYLPLEYETGRPRGFGFVEFAHTRDAQEALRTLNEGDLEGARISISVAQHGRKTPSTMRTRSGGYRRPRGTYRREPYSAPDRYDRSGSPRSYGGRGGYDDRREYRDAGYGREYAGGRGETYDRDMYRDRKYDARAGEREYRDGGYRDGGYRENYRDYERRRY